MLVPIPSPMSRTTTPNPDYLAVGAYAHRAVSPQFSGGWDGTGKAFGLGEKVTHACRQHKALTTLVAGLFRLGPHFILVPETGIKTICDSLPHVRTQHFARVLVMFLWCR